MDADMHGTEIYIPLAEFVYNQKYGKKQDSNGKYQFVSDECDINEKVIDLLEDSLTPYLEQFAVDWNVNNVQQIIPNPSSIISLKKNQLFTVQFIFSAEQLKEDIEFDISFFDPQENKQIKYSVVKIQTTQQKQIIIINWQFINSLHHMKMLQDMEINNQILLKWINK